MNTDRFDDALRARHAASLDHLSPRTRAQLQLRRRAALADQAPAGRVPAWRLAWPVAVACAVGAIVLGLQIRGLETPAPPASVAEVVVASTMALPSVAEGDDSLDYATLEEHPDLYVWLASDGAMLAME
jgi:hypothetical protein